MNELVRTDGAARLFCTFRMEGRLYGVDAALVREISTQTAFTPVPQAPPAVRGLANLRSRIYLVADVRPILGLEPAACTEASRFIIVKPQVAENLGILVEQGGDIVRVTAEQVEDAPSAAADATEAGENRASAVLAGVCKLDGELMNVVDLVKLVETVESLMQ
jgi:purine-binding chemotaxis protein CheW